MGRSKVGVVKTAPSPDRDEIMARVRQVVDLAGGLPAEVAAGKKILLKPNLVAVPRSVDSGAVTHPEVCRAVADLVKERGALPVIADSSSVGCDTEEVIRFMGYDRLREEGYTVLDLKQEPVVTVRCPAFPVMPRLRVFAAALQAAAVINLPVMKTHDQVEITLGLKNLKGLLDDVSKKLMHRRGVVRGVVETAAFFKPCFTLLDGIYAQEGAGPVYGDPVEMDLLLASRDPVALDTIGGLIMGYRPEEVPITVEAARQGLGTMELHDIEVMGIPWEEVRLPFRRAAQAAALDRELPCALNLAAETCSGCRNTVIAVLASMAEHGLLDALHDKAVVTGCPPQVPAGDLVLVGRCARPLKDLGRFVDGCPPENSWVIEALLEVEPRK